MVYPLKFSYQCIVKQNSYFVTNLVSLVALLHPFKFFWLFVVCCCSCCFSLVKNVYSVVTFFLCGFVFVAHNESHVVHFVNYTTIMLL